MTMASRSCIRSAQVAVPVRLVRARVWRVEMATGLEGLRAKPLGKPARSMSHAAGSFTSPEGVGQLGIRSAGMLSAWAMWVTVAAGTIGFLKKEPAERVSGLSTPG